MSDVLGTAWIEIRAKLDKFTRDMSGGVQNQVGGAANKAAQSVARSAQTANTALKANTDAVKSVDAASKAAATSADKLSASERAAADAAQKSSKQQKDNTDNIRTVDSVSKAAAAAQQKLAAAEATAAATANKYGKESLQARAATIQVKNASSDLERQLGNTNKETGRLQSVAQHSGRAAGAMFGVLVQNSQGALGPIQEVYDKLQGVGSALQDGRSKAGKWAVGIGAAATGVGTVLGTISSKEVGAQKALEGALSGTGHSWEEYSKQIEANVKRGEHFGNTAATTMTVLNRLTLATHNPAAAMKTYQSTLDLAAARHIPVERAAILMGRAINGNTTGLKAFGIQVQSTTVLEKSQATATKAHATAMEGVKKAQERLRDTEARLKDSHKATGTSALSLASAHLSVESAQNSLRSAMDKYGPGTIQVQMAQQRLALAQGHYNEALNKGHGSTALTVSQQITLRHAQEALKAAQEKATKTANDQTKAHHALAKAGSTVDQINKQVSKYMGGQASAQANTFTGHLHALAAVVDDNVAKFGAKLFPALVTAGPLLMGVGAIIETGVIGKFKSASKTALGFANAEGEVSKFSVKNVAVQVASGIKTAAIWTAQTAKVIAFRAASIAAAAAQKVQAAAQWALNAAMDANPIGLIVIAIAALAAGVIYAYKHSETFRNVVQGAMHGIATAGKFMWNDVLKPVLSALMTAIDFVRDHWKVFATVFAFLIGGPIIGAIVLLATHFTTVKNIAVGAWRAIQNGAQWMWDHVLRPVFATLANVFMTVVGTIIDGAAAAFGWVPGIGGKLKGAAKAFDGFRDDVNAALNGIGDKTVHISAVAQGDYLKDPAFAKFAKQAASTFTAADWRRITANSSKKAMGGLVQGAGGPRDDNQLHWLSPGEFVVNAYSTRRHKTLLEAINGKGYADGGLIPSVDTSRALSGIRAQIVGADAYTGGIADLIGSRASVLAGMLHHVKRGREATGGLAKMIPAGSRAALIDRALTLAHAATSSGNEAAVNLIVTNESGWNRRAINNWDSNAMAGDPSRGLMQTIGSTFEAYRLKSLPDDIYNAIANLVAGIRYAMSRYGSLLNVPGVKSVATGGPYMGYAAGGKLPAGKIVGVNTRTGQGITLNENGQEWVIPDNLMPSMAQMRAALTAPPEGSLGALTATYKAAERHLGTARSAAHRAAARYRPAQRRISHDETAIRHTQDAIDNAAHRIRQIQGSHQPTYIKNREIKQLRDHEAALREHEKALRKDEDSTKRHSAAAKKAADAAEKNLKAAQKAANDAKAAIRQSVLAGITSLVQNFQQSGMQGMGLTDVFHYQAGYGAGGARGAINMIKQRIRDMRAFGRVLKALAKKGLQADFLQQLIAAGPQEGLAIGQQLLADPSSISTIQGLEEELNKITSSIGGQIASAAYHITQPAHAAHHAAHHHKKRTAPYTRAAHRSHHTTPRQWGPGIPTREYATADDSGATGRDAPLLEVHGDFVVRNDSDLQKIQSMLVTASASQTRATGTTR